MLNIEANDFTGRIAAPLSLVALISLFQPDAGRMGQPVAALILTLKRTIKLPAANMQLTLTLPKRTDKMTSSNFESCRVDPYQNQCGPSTGVPQVLAKPRTPLYRPATSLVPANKVCAGATGGSTWFQRPPKQQLNPPSIPNHDSLKTNPALTTSTRHSGPLPKQRSTCNSLLSTSVPD